MSLEEMGPSRYFGISRGFIELLLLKCLIFHRLLEFDTDNHSGHR